jgi:hypothetical protein
VFMYMIPGSSFFSPFFPLSLFAPSSVVLVCLNEWSGRI